MGRPAYFAGQSNVLIGTTLVPDAGGPGARRGSRTKIPRSVAEAADARDALAKELYSLLFDWLVARVNSSMDRSSQSHRTIGVLDIFGFEAFDVNSFEQVGRSRSSAVCARGSPPRSTLQARRACRRNLGGREGVREGGVSCVFSASSCSPRTGGDYATWLRAPRIRCH